MTIRVERRQSAATRKVGGRFLHATEIRGTSTVARCICLGFYELERSYNNTKRRLRESEDRAPSGSRITYRTDTDSETLRAKLL